MATTPTKIPNVHCPIQPCIIINYNGIIIRICNGMKFTLLFIYFLCVKIRGSVARTFTLVHRYCPRKTLLQFALDMSALLNHLAQLIFWIMKSLSTSEERNCDEHLVHLLFLLIIYPLIINNSILDSDSKNLKISVLSHQFLSVRKQFDRIQCL